MKYYKLQTDTEFVGIINSNNFVRENTRNKWLFTSNETRGQYVSYNNNLYRDYWMQPTLRDRNFIQINIIEITQEEYDTLHAAIERNEEITIEEYEEDIPEEEEIPYVPDITLEFVRSSKINEMSHACRTTIESGIDFQIHGGTKHFSLTTQDQLNLMSAQTMAQTQTLIPYHADGEETAFYTSEEINQLAEAVAAFKVQHTTYYNSLKTYINALETIEEISAITYGVEIPDTYKSVVLKVLEL